MAGFQDFWSYEEDFDGHKLFSATAGSNVGHNLLIADTSAAGSPTYVVVDGAAGPGELAVDMAATSEAENVCVYMGDNLCYDIDLILGAEFRVKMNQAAMDATSMFAIGLAGDRNDAIDTIAQAALFRVVGADSTTAVVVETDDGTTNNDDVATGQTLINAHKWLKLDFSNGTSDVRFYMSDGNSLTRVASATTFDMSAYTGALQFFAQIQKTPDTNTDGFTLDAIKIWGKRA